MPFDHLPNAIAALVQPRLTHCTPLHPGLLLDRLPERQHIENQEHQKAHLARVVAASPWRIDEYRGTIRRLEGGLPVFTNTARSRIAVHLSRAGGLENANCCLHPVHGFAYLPGSGLKGLAHAYAAHLWGSGQVPEAQRPAFAREVEDLFGWAPNRERTEPATAYQPRSGRAGARDSESQRGAVVFHDAFATEPPKLEIDVCTPHYGPYYMEGKDPGDWHSPVPVTFLTIAASTQFRFRVTAAHSGVEPALVEAAKRLLLGGLYWLGAGAKTAAGYGAFEGQFTEPDEQIRARKESDAAAAKAAAVTRLEALWSSLDHAKQALWVAKQDNSKTGYRVQRQADGTWTWDDGWNFKDNPKTTTKQVMVADINPAAPKRLGNPKVQDGIDPPPARPA